MNALIPVLAILLGVTQVPIAAASTKHAQEQPSPLVAQLVSSFSATDQAIFVQAVENIKANRPHQALRLLESLHTKYGNNPYLWYYTGRAFYQLGKYGLAYGAFDLVVQFKPNSVDSLYWTALSNYKMAELAISRQSTGQEEINRQLRVIIKEYSKVIALDPSYTAAYMDRAYVYTSLGDHQKAIKDYLQAIRLGAKTSWAFNDLGWNYIQSGEPRKALLYFKQALAVDPANETAARNLAYVDAQVNSKPSPAYMYSYRPSYSPSSSFGTIPNYLEKHPSSPSSPAAYYNQQRCGDWSGC